MVAEPLHALDEQLRLIRWYSGVTEDNIHRDHMAWELFNAFTTHPTEYTDEAKVRLRQLADKVEEKGGQRLSMERITQLHDTTSAWELHVGDEKKGGVNLNVLRQNGDHDRAMRPEVRAMLNQEAVSLNKSETFFVTSDMSRIIEAAARTAPCDPLRLTDLPCPYGFVYFDRPLESTMVKDQVIDMTETDENVGLFTDELPLTIRAIRWEPNGNTQPQWADRYLQEKGLNGQDMQVKWKGPGVILAIYTDQHVKRLHLSHVFGWSVDTIWTETDKEWTDKSADGIEPTEVHYSIGFYRKVLLSFFRLTFQKIAVVHKERQVRQAVRRAVREGMVAPDTGTINVVKLRREQQHPSGDPSHAQEWSHRWWVQGFWRNQFYPSLNRHQAVYIHPYIKGPLDKPLILKDRIYSLER